MTKTGTKVKLSALAPADSETLRAWINDRELVLNNAPYRPVHAAQHEAWFAAVQERPDAVIFAIRLVDGDRLIGTCQLLQIHPVHRSAELQIRIGEADARGQGHGSEAVRLLLDFAFRDLNLHRVYLNVFASNAAAIRAYEKAGFIHEGTAREAAFIDGRYVDVAQMAALAPAS